MAESTTPKFVRYKGEHWDALYMDGKLVQAGDPYLTDEKLETLVGVDVRHSEAFMLGGHDYEHVGGRLEDVEAYDVKLQAGIHAAEAQMAMAKAAVAAAEEAMAAAKAAQAEAGR